MRFIGSFLFALIAILFIEFLATTETMVRQGDTMQYKLKYVRLRQFREEGAAEFQLRNAGSIDSRAVHLRNELAKAVKERNRLND